MEPVIPAEPEENKNLGFDKWTFNPSPNEQSDAPQDVVDPPSNPSPLPSSPPKDPVEKTISPNKDLDFDEYQDIEEEDTQKANDQDL